MQATTLRVAVTTFVAVLTIAVQPSAQSQTFTTIDPPDSTSTYVAGLNPSGVIAGSYSDANYVSHGYVRAADGTITSFDPPGSTGTTPEAINPGGAITGFYSDANGVSHGFVRAVNGNISSFDVPGAGTGSYQGTAGYAINPSGAIAGYYTDAAYVSHGFLRAVGGEITTFDVPGSQGTQPLSIDPSGVITGDYTPPPSGPWGFTIPYGFVRDAKGNITTIAPSTIYPPSYLVDDYPIVNEAGTIAGTATNQNMGASGFYLRAKDGAIDWFNNLPGLVVAFGVAINPEGAMTGNYFDGTGIASFVRTADGQVSVIADPNAGTGFFQGTSANSINAAGQIAGYYTDGNYVPHGFLRNP